MSNLYIVICSVAHVRADGVSLSPKFSVKTLKNSGNFDLEYNSHASIEAPVDAPVVDTQNVEAQGHQILNMLLQYIPGYQNHQALDEDEDEDEDEEFYDDHLVDEEEGNGELI